MRNLAKEHENEEDEEFKGNTDEINDTNKSKLSKDKTKEALISSLLAKNVTQSNSSSHFLHQHLQTRHDSSR